MIHESLGYKTPYEIYFKELFNQQLNRRHDYPANKTHFFALTMGRPLLFVTSDDEMCSQKTVQ